MELKLGVAGEAVELDNVLQAKKVDREEYCAIELEMKNVEGKKSLFGKVKPSVKQVINFGDNTEQRDKDFEKVVASLGGKK
jgi:hypothetical protein